MPSSTDVRPAAPARDLARCNRPGIAMRGASHPPMTPRPWFALALLCLASCREPAAGGKPVTVYAAASLSVAFEALGKEFAAQHPGASAKFVFEGSPSLVFKLQQGSRADVLATADRAQHGQGREQQAHRRRAARVRAQSLGDPGRARQP
jgi:hypothetical protein